MAIAAALWRSRGRGCGPTEFFGAPILCGFDRVLEGFWDLGSLATRAIQEAQQPLNEDHTGRETLPSCKQYTVFLLQTIDERMLSERLNIIT